MRFDSYHPAINFIFFTCAILFAALFTQPVFALVSYLAAFAFSVMLGGKRAVIFNLVLIPFAIAGACFFAFYTHFGITDIAINFIGNHITLEALALGINASLRVMTVLIWISCVHSVITSDKVIYLIGRLSPRLSLFLSILLRSVPRIKAQVKKISLAQKMIKKGVNCGLLGKIKNAVRIFSITVTWVFEGFSQISDSMRSRGYALKHRTAFSVYRFDNRDRGVVLLMFFGIIIACAAILFDQTSMLFSPQIVLGKITPASFFFYFAYALFCFLPSLLETLGEIKVKRALRG